MMTDSQKSFVKVKLWFSKLIVESQSEQKKQTDKLLKDGVLDDKQIKLLRDMLQADQETGMVTNIESVSSEIINEATSQETTLNNKQIGPYKIISTLGEGGMGQVYLAQRNDGQYQQQVALKLPHSSFNQHMLERFENERQILAQLTHNNIARLLDGGTAENNQPYLVMEHIQGKNIDHYCTENIPSLYERLQLILQICSAVTFSHQQLVLHRDLKPSNILVTESGQVKLLDFGIAKLLDLDEEAKAKHTATQIMTRYYASPEQLQGKSASTHSDMFSLAIIAYELITGYHPFQHKTQHEREQNLISGKVMRVTQRTDYTEALLPELAKIPSVKLQGDLENILLKALSVDPDKRYGSVKDFADDLYNYLENKPVTARKPSTLYFINKWIQRHKSVTLLIFVTLITLITATFYSIGKANHALIQQQIAESESEKSHQVSEFLKKLFKKAKPMSASTQLTAQDLLFQGFKDIENEEFKSSDTKFELIDIIHRSLISMGKLQESGEKIQSHINDCTEKISKQHKTCVQLLLVQSDIYHKQHQWQKSLDITKQAEKLVLARNPIDYEEVADVYADLNANLINLNRKEEAREYIYKTIEISKKENPPNIKRIIQTTHNLALSFIFEKNHEKAKELIDKIPNYLAELPDKSQPVWLGSHYGLKAYYYSKIGEAEKSYQFRLKRVKLMESSYELLPIKHGRYIRSAAGMAKRAGYTEKAIDLYKRSYEFYLKNVTNSAYYQYEILTYLTLHYLSIGQIEEANETFNIIQEAYQKDPLLDGYAKISYYSIAKLFIDVSKLPTEQTQIRLDELYKELEPRFGKFKSYKMYLAAIGIKINIQNNNLSKAQELLETIHTILENHPNDYGTYKILAAKLMTEIEKLN